MDLPASAPPAEIVVTGRALEALAPLGLSLGPLQLATASGRVEDALLAVPSLAAFRRASTATASPTAQGITTRALGGNAASRALLTLDGVPQADLFAGWVAWVPVNAARIETARVVRGAAGVTDGPGALAGAIELASAPPASETALRGGSRASLDLGGEAAVPAGGGHVSLAARGFAGDGHLLVDPDLAGPVDVPARYRQWGARARALAAVGGEGELQATLATFRDRRLRGVEGAETGASGTDASLRLVRRGELPVEALVFGQIRDFDAKNYPINAARTSATLVLDQFQTPASGWGGKVELRPLPGLSLGGDWRAARGETNERFRFVASEATALRRAGGAATTVGLFAEAALAIGAGVQVSGGARVDFWRFADGFLVETDLLTGALIRDEPAPDRRGTLFSGNATLEWQPAGAEAFTLGASVWRSARLPTLNELHRPFRAGADATAANPLLAPERLTGVEGRVRYQPVPAARISVAGYWSRLADPIANVTLAQGPGVFPGVGFVAANGSYRQRRNLEAIRTAGLEADAELASGPWAIRAGLARMFATVDGGDTAPALDDQRPAQTPKFAGQLGVSFTRSRLALAADLRHEGGRFEDDLNTRALAPATTLDLGARLVLARRLALTVDVANATGETVEVGFSGNLVERAEPRTILVGLKVGG